MRPLSGRDVAWGLPKSTSLAPTLSRTRAWVRTLERLRDSEHTFSVNMAAQVSRFPHGISG